FFNATPSTAIYTLSLHDALPIFARSLQHHASERPARIDRYGKRLALAHDPVRLRDGLERLPLDLCARGPRDHRARDRGRRRRRRSEEHTSELQSLAYLVCRLLLE